MRAAGLRADPHDGDRHKCNWIADCNLPKVAPAPVSTRNADDGTAALFHNPLLDRCAANYVSFGRPDASCLPNDATIAFTEANDSSIHLDAMVGTPQMNVDGIHDSGRIEPIMRLGEFVI